MAYGIEEDSPADSTKSEDEKLLQETRDFIKHCIDNEEPQREQMMDDLRFCTLDQWPTEIRNEREGDLENGPRPCLTIDKINQYIVQVVNDMRQGRPGINVRPQDDNADVQTAKVLKGLIRNIEDQSSADIAYSSAGESAAKIGLGYFRIATDYVSDDSFDQEIFIRPLPNTFAVYLGPHIMPDGSDAKEGVIVEVMEIAKFKETYPGKKCTPDEFSGLDAPIRAYWRQDDVITVVEYFCIKRFAQEILFLDDGTTITEEDYKAWPQMAGPKPGVQDRRRSFKEQLKWSKMTGVEILEKRDLPGKYIPIVEVIGRESNIEGQRILWGLVRPAKDSLRMYNYWASTLTEKFGLAPKTPFVGAKGQFEGLEDKWKKANRTNFPYLEYNPIDVNGNALPRPERQGPTPMEAAYFQQMQVIEHDVQTSLGMFKAATGESESQQSGRAILALQKESDTGTYHFGANLGISIRHAGRIIVDMIPHYYDTKRVIRIIGDDGEIQTAQLDPDQETSYREVEGVGSIYNPGVGKWDVSITTGPSYNTKRMEAQATFVEMAKGAADPASAAILRYLVMRNSDASGSDEASKLLKTVLPPQALQAMASKDPIPPQVQAMMQQVQAKAAAMQEEMAKLQQENVQLKAGAQVQAIKINADQQASAAEFANQKAKQDGELQLARDKAVAEINLKREVAAAEIELEKLKAGIGSDAAIDTAIQKVGALATVHQTKIQAIFDKEAAKQEVANAEAEGEAKAQDSSEAVAQVQALQQQFMQAIQEIVKGLTAKKNITLKMSDGRTATATVN